MSVQEQRVWLSTFTRGAVALPTEGVSNTDRFGVVRATELEADRRMRELHIARVTHRLRAMHEDLSEQFVFSVTTEAGKKLPTLGKGGQQAEAFDSRGDNRLAEAVDGTRMSSLWVLQEELHTLCGSLERLTTTQTRLVDGELVSSTVPLFERDDVASEVYHPLVRQLILPENFVPDGYSETAKMLEASNDYYLEELAAFEAADVDVESKKAVVGLLSMGTKELAKGLGADPDVTDGAIDLLQGVSEASLDVYAELKNGQNRGVVASSFLSAMGDVAAGAITSFAPVEPEAAKALAKIAKLSIKTGAASVKAVAALNRDGAPDIDGFLEAYVEMIVNTLDVGALADEGDGVSTASGIIGSVATRLVAAKKDKLVDSIRNHDVNALLNLSTSVLLAVGENVLSDDSNAALEGTDGELGRLRDAFANADVVAALVARGEDADRELAVVEAEEAEVRLTAERERFHADLATLGQADYLSDSDLHSIAQLVAKLERDRQIMESAFKVGGAGLAVASEFCGALGAAGTLLRFLEVLAAAVERAVHMRKWEASNRDALVGTSPYLTSIVNFVENQREQFAHHTIKAALVLLQAGAQIASASGVAAPITTAIDKSAAALEKVEDLLYRFHREQDVKAAWKQTIKALRDPRDRRAGLIARKMNPTLAKYTLAYGAAEVGDPLARQAVARIGLTSEVLAHRDSKVEAVKDYFKALYPDDTDVVGRLPPGILGWMRTVPPAALELSVWAQTFEIAVRQGDLSPARPTGIERSLHRVGPLLDAFDEAIDLQTLDVAEARAAEVQNALATLENALEGYAPRFVSGTPHVDMRTIADQFIEVVRARQMQCAADLDRISRATD